MTASIRTLPADLMTTRQAALLLNCSHNSLNDHRRRGNLKGYGPRQSLISWTEAQALWASKGKRDKLKQAWRAVQRERDRQRKFAIDAKENR